MHYHYVRGNYEETNTQNHAKSPCFEKIPNTSILVRIGIRRLIHSLLPQNAAGRVVGVVRRVLQRGGHQRKRPARAPTLRPPAHATRQSRQAKLRRAIERTPPSSQGIS
jgi:hypothetical protein